tara:strand:+ start:236 stop:430 length:195 start_codon:yes stop_codon:yes gene_type:complete
MNEKWEQRKIVLNKKKMLTSMMQIQENMHQISKIDFDFQTSDVEKFSEFKEYSENFLKLIKDKH